MTQPISRRAALARTAYLMGGVLSASTIAGVLAGCDGRTAANGVRAAGATLDADQKELVATIADHIIPETDTPGARAAQVEEFIDAMLSDYYDEEQRQRFLAGLQRVEDRSQRVFGSRLADATAEQQYAMVEALNRQTFEDPQRLEASAAMQQRDRETDTETGRSGADASQAAVGAAGLDGDWDPADVGRQSFFRTLKELVLVGYYTSEIGATQELQMHPWGSWRADIPYSEVGRAWA